MIEAGDKKCFVKITNENKGTITTDLCLGSDQAVSQTEHIIWCDFFMHGVYQTTSKIETTDKVFMENRRGAMAKMIGVVQIHSRKAGLLI